MCYNAIATARDADQVRARKPSPPGPPCFGTIPHGRRQYQLINWPPMPRGRALFWAAAPLLPYFRITTAYPRNIVNASALPLLNLLSVG